MLSTLLFHGYDGINDGSKSIPIFHFAAKVHESCNHPGTSLFVTGAGVEI